MKCPKCFKEMKQFDSYHWRCEEHFMFNDTYLQGFWAGYEKGVSSHQADTADGKKTCGYDGGICEYNEEGICIKCRGTRP